MSWTEPGMFTSSGTYLTLSNSDVHIEIDEMIATITTTHTYTNTENTNIEAVYTFPIPREAVLLLMQATIGERTLKGYYVEREEATRRYEAAISDGDSAILVEHVESGMQSMSVGNIMAGESVTVTVKYGLVLRWNADTVRMQLPSTISPRYGAPPSSRPAFLEPVVSIFNKNTIIPKIVIRGILASAAVSSPSHKFQYRFDRERGELVASSKKPIIMDRDLILTFTSDTAERSWALAVPDGDDTLILAGLNVHVPEVTTRQNPVELVYVIDCSGSMAGDSIRSARQAVVNSIQRLTPKDRANAIAFGDHPTYFSGYTHLMNDVHRDQLSNWCARLDANLGGTNAYAAISEALTLMRRGSIMFITDGEVNNWEMIVNMAKRHSVRIFTIGIGAAPNMPFVETLAIETGGACEFIAPGEDVERAVARQTRRILNTGSSSFVLRNGADAREEWTDSKRDIVYDGDTVLYTAKFTTAPENVTISKEDGSGLAKATVSASTNPEIRRIAASLRLPDLSDAEAKANALRYQLVSKHTSCLVVDVRVAEEKADSLPELRRVAQTLSSGWGGYGSADVDQPVTRMMRKLDTPTYAVRSYSKGSSYGGGGGGGGRRYSYSRDAIDEYSSIFPVRTVSEAVDHCINELVDALTQNLDLVHCSTFDEFFIDPKLAQLRQGVSWIVTAEVTERDVIVMILRHVVEHHASFLSAEALNELTAIVQAS